MFEICTFGLRKGVARTTPELKTLDVCVNIVSVEETISVEIRSVQT